MSPSMVGGARGRGDIIAPATRVRAVNLWRRRRGIGDEIDVVEPSVIAAESEVETM